MTITLEKADLTAAVRLVSAHMAPTPQMRWPLLSNWLGASVIVKHENHSPIGSFKIRGALTYFADLKASAPQVTSVLASTRSNHGQAVAFAARCYGFEPIIIVPCGNLKEKNEAMRALGATLIEFGNDYQEAREHGEMLARSNHYHLVKSFTKSWLRGVATGPWELLNAEPDLEVLYVPIGMGSGICSAIIAKEILGHDVEIVGVVAENAPAYSLSFKAGKVVSTQTAKTIADGLSARSPNPEALECMMNGAARIITVTEREILSAMKAYILYTHNLAEPAAAAALAGAVTEQSRLRGKKVAFVLSGGNASVQALKECLGV